MKIQAKNQHDTNIAEVQVTVGCGLDGDEGNEPSFAYTITPDGVSIFRDTDDGSSLGAVNLNNSDLDLLCGVPFVSTPSPEFESRVFRIVKAQMGPGTELYTNEAAKAKLLKCLAHVWSPGAVGKAWVLSTHRSGWTELGYRDFAAAEDSAAVMVDSVDSGDAGQSWKYTYYPENRVGMYLEQK